MLTLTSFRFFSSAIRSRTGATAWQGPHHSAQKSTRTGSPLWSTSLSNVSSVTSFAIRFLSSLTRGPVRTRSSRLRTLGSTLRFPNDDRASLPAPPDGARPSRPRGGGPRLVGAGAGLRAAPGEERRRTSLLVHRRPRDGEQDPWRAHGLGPD